jgi:hypothetical protein
MNHFITKVFGYGLLSKRKWKREVVFCGDKRDGAERR